MHPQGTQSGWKEEPLTQNTSSTDVGTTQTLSLTRESPKLGGSKKLKFVLEKKGKAFASDPQPVRSNRAQNLLLRAQEGRAHRLASEAAFEQAEAPKRRRVDEGSQQYPKKRGPIGPLLPNGNFIKTAVGTRPPYSSSQAHQKPAKLNYSFYKSPPISPTKAKHFTRFGSSSHQNPLKPIFSKLKSRRSSGSSTDMAAQNKLSDILSQEALTDATNMETDKSEDDIVLDSLAPALNIVGVGVCVECEEAAADVKCDQCDDMYCNMCFAILHRKGNRAKHTSTKLPEADRLLALKNLGITDDKAKSQTQKSTNLAELGVGSNLKRLSAEWFKMRAKYIPVRLHLKERKRLRLVVASLAVSDYTGRIDKASLLKGTRRQHQQLKEMCSNFTGLIVSEDKESGMDVVNTREFSEYSPFLQNVFEYARRYKIMNPEKLRTNYGKMIYMMQDASEDRTKELLQFSLNRNIKTVYSFFKENDILGVLSEPAIADATMEILPENKSRSTIQYEIKTKESAQERIAKKYCKGSSKLKESIKWCLYSISDNFSYLNSNRKPVDTMIMYLKEYFKPDTFEDGFSFAITGGVDGARLTHDHTRHYHYVLQSLTLWREIADDMFRLWTLAEDDLTAEGNKYILKDTGQGLHRVQASPKVLSAMRTILHNCQQNLGEWIGSSVIHLGDSNVPNAMMFVDKYTQVARILSPILQTIREIDNLIKEDGVRTFIIKGYGSALNLKKMILHDFFKNAFDGSGADNFFDAGSCIDGRLTSAWNWCSTLKDKPFYLVFLLSGFAGFDGSMQE